MTFESANIHVGVTYTDEQLRTLAPSAVALGDAAVSRERWKRELDNERKHGDVRVREHLMSRDAYKEAKRKYREALARYEEAKKGL